MGGNKVSYIEQEILHLMPHYMALDSNIYDERDVLVANISRKFLTIGDKYTIDIFDDSRLIEILSIIVCITNDVDRNQRNSSN